MSFHFQKTVQGSTDHDPRRASSTEIEENREMMTRLGLTLCEIALCAPVIKSKHENGHIWFHYGGSWWTKEDIIREVKASSFRGHYAQVVQECLSFADDSFGKVAPVDVVCEILERARGDLQEWYDEVLCSHRDKQQDRDWLRRLHEDHDRRMMEKEENFRNNHPLRSRAGQSIQ